MANENDSFIDEVTEDLRRDRLFGLFRRYGWIAIALILAIVLGAAWREYRISKAATAAQKFGDAILTAEEDADPAMALGKIDSKGKSAHAALADLLQANALFEAGETDQAGDVLDGAAATLGEDNRVMRDLALLKRVMIEGDQMDAAKRDQILSQLAQTGAPFELLALEQQAIALVGAGRLEDAETLIRHIQAKDGMSEGLRRRLSELMIAMGVEPEPTDTTPASE